MQSFLMLRARPVHQKGIFTGKYSGFMNPYASKLMTYHLVHQLQREGFSVSYISKYFVMDWRTVKKYLSMSEPEYEQFLEAQSDRKKELEPYEGFVKSKLSKYPDTSSAQMYDWLKEHYPGFPCVNSKTVFNFVAWVRQKYHILKTNAGREYEMVEEAPYGSQAQADFGEYNLRNSQGRKVKVHFMTMVLSRSRYKWVFFSTSKFKTEGSIDGHERAFGFFEGVADTVVYDQDRVFLVDENKGDLVLTEKFRTYSRQCGFKLHFCRKADPESKGKIENVVKYVKQNFLYNRPFSDIETLNQEALAWLARTANHMPHSSTRKQPGAEWEIEKQYLKPYHPASPKTNEPLVYSVRKDNSISFRGNFYSLPLGTYKGKGCQVHLVPEDGKLQIYDSKGALLCTHDRSPGKGQKIINNDHKREKSAGIKTLMVQVCTGLENPDQGQSFLDAIRTEKPRYLRDQILLLKQTIERHPREIITRALAYCCTHRLYSAVDLKSIAGHFNRQQTSPDVKEMQMNPLTGAMPGEAFIQPATSSIADYDIF